MANLNKVFLMGNLTRDVRISYLPSNTPVAALGMAINRRWIGQDGQKHEETTFVDLTMFGKRAEVLAKYLRKGDPLFVVGRLRFETWDAKDGTKRTRLSVVVEDFEFMSRRAGEPAVAGEEGEPDHRPGPRPAQKPARPPADAEPQQAPSAEEYSTDGPAPPADDIPF